MRATQTSINESPAARRGLDFPARSFAEHVKKPHLPAVPQGSTAVVLRPGYGASVNMFTADNVGLTRPHIKTNEVVNGETPSGAFLTNSALPVLTSGVDAFANGYYEHLDWQRIPGTTIDRALPRGS